MKLFFFVGLREFLAFFDVGVKIIALKKEKNKEEEEKRMPCKFQYKLN